MSQYRRGVYREHKVIHHLEKLGFTVTRSAGSKGVVDLMALRKDGTLLFVQVKTSNKLDHSEWNELYEMAGWVGAVPLIAESLPRQPVSYMRIIDSHKFRSHDWPCVEYAMKTSGP